MDYMSYIRAIRSSDLTCTQKITAIMIASHYDFTKKEPAFPSNKLLAKETGLSVSTIVKSKKVLSDKGYLCSQIRWDNSCLYTPMLPDSIAYTHKEKVNTHINTHINNNINTQLNTITDSNESVVSINNLHQEDGETILDLNEKASFDDLFNMFEGNSLDTKKDNRRRPAGGGHRNNTKINQSSRSDDYSDAEKSRFTEELDFARNSEW